MKGKILNFLNRLLSRLGFVLVGKQWLKENTFKIVDLRTSGVNISPVDALSFFSVQKLKFVLNIPIDRIVTSKPMKAWIETARLIDKEDHSVPFRERASFLFLQDFYQSFQPENVAERIGLTVEYSNDINRKYLESQPLYAVMPWEIISTDNRFKLYLDGYAEECLEYGNIIPNKEDGVDIFGPVSQSILEMEYHRLLSVYNSIKKQGYNEQHGYPVAGSVFVTGNEYKLSILGGRHRVAVMLALQYEYIPVTVSKDKSVKLLRDDVETWHHVKSGLFSKEQALELFDKQVVIE